MKKRKQAAPKPTNFEHSQLVNQYANSNQKQDLTAKIPHVKSSGSLHDKINGKHGEAPPVSKEDEKMVIKNLATQQNPQVPKAG